jgi:hypothetical protein
MSIEIINFEENSHPISNNSHYLTHPISNLPPSDKLFIKGHGQPIDIDMHFFGRMLSSITIS